MGWVIGCVAWLLCMCVGCASPDATPERLARLSPVWTSPSADDAGSMPLGNGVVGANVHVAPNGDLVLLLSRVDAFSEIERLLKLGRVRVQCDPPWMPTPAFRQHLDVYTGKIVVLDAGLRIDVVPDDAHDVIHVEMRSSTPRRVTARLETWRDAPRRLEGGEAKSAWLVQGAPKGVVLEESADVVVDDPNAVVWYHRNETSAVPLTLSHQGLDTVRDAFPDPLKDRTFGGKIAFVESEKIDARTVATTKPVNLAELRIATACAVVPKVDDWRARLDAVDAASGRFDAAARRTADAWRTRWDRSWIFVEPASATPGTTSPSAAWALQRYATAAATRGEFPMKFNGSIFTVAPKFVNGATWNEDFRNWGGDFWWQNTRLPYHGMLERGDGDLAASLFDFYTRVAEGCRARAKVYEGVDGIYFPETMSTFGTYANDDYGWDRTGRKSNDVACEYWKWAWNQGPELVALMLDHYDMTRDGTLLRTKTLPLANGVLAWFDGRFPRAADGTLKITPTQSVETYWRDVVNDLPCVVGLHEILGRLRALPRDEVGDAGNRALWDRLAAALPPVPTRTTDTGETVFAPAASFSPQRFNCENPELWAVWPFRWSGVGRDTLDVGRATYRTRIEKMTHGWTQDGQQAARVGLASEAAANLDAKLRNTHKNFRFPTFWGPNFDWLPDQCHGANLMTTFQEMLLQSVGDTIVVCPALPTDWSGTFRLWASGKTRVTVTLETGRVTSLDVYPEHRKADVVLGEGWRLDETPPPGPRYKRL